MHFVRKNGRGESVDYKFNMHGKNEIYIVMVYNGETPIKKICCSVKCKDTDIIITPGFCKTYCKDQYCESECKNKENCNRKWNDNCFSNVNQNFLYRMHHTTRHKDRIHRTAYFNGEPVSKDNPMRDYFNFSRPLLSDIVKYELISGISFSPAIVRRNIAKDYKKENKNVLELIALEKIQYNVYIFLNPKNNNRLYKDLQKYKIDSYTMECDKYEIVIGVDILEPLTSISIYDFTGMYISEGSVK